MHTYDALNESILFVSDARGFSIPSFNGKYRSDVLFFRCLLRSGECFIMRTASSNPFFAWSFFVARKYPSGAPSLSLQRWSRLMQLHAVVLPFFRPISQSHSWYCLYPSSSTNPYIADIAALWNSSNLIWAPIWPCDCLQNFSMNDMCLLAASGL